MATRSAIEVQQLESKQLLTGVVTLAISGSNDVSITGDSSANDIDVTIQNGQLSVVGNAGTLIRFGGNAAVAAINNVTVPGIRDLNVDLKGGDDNIYVEVGSALTIGRNVNVSTGSGSDYVEVYGNAALTVNGSLRVSTGSGDDIVDLGTDGALMTVKGNAVVDTGSGKDAVAIIDYEKLGAANTAAEFQAIPNDSNTVDAQQIRIGRNLTIRTGSDNDAVGIVGVQVGRDAEIHSGFGHGDIVGITNMRVGRNLNLIYGDDNAMTDVTVGGKLKVRSGTGDDRFAASDIRASVIDVNLGSGNDQLAIGAGVTASRATINGGTGRDNIIGPVAAGAKVKSFEGNAVDLTILDDVLGGLAEAGLYIG